MKQKIGFNLGEDTARKVAALNEQELMSLRKNARRVFSEKFELSVAKNKLEKIIEKL